MMPLYVPSNRIVAFAVLSAASLALLVGASLYQMFHTQLQFSAGGTASVPAGSVYLSGNAAGAVASSSPAQQPMLEVNIANNGLVLLRGARVVSVSGGTIQVAVAFGAGNFTWKARTNSDTEFFASDGQKGTLDDIVAGDTVTVTGMLADGGGQPAINAEFVRQ
jgi:hypothetical protein